MRFSKDLWELVHALSPSEKRYFRIFASRHVQQGKNNYMRIFDLIEQQVEFDEAELLRELKDDKLKAQFAVQKNYLHKLILKSLRNFHAEASIDFEIKELLMNVELLLRKDLIYQSLKQLAKAEQLALANEKYEYLFEIGAYRISMALKVQDADLDKLGQTLQQIFENSHLYFARYENIQAYRKLSMQMLLLNRKEPQAQSEEARNAYARIMGDPLMQGEEKALSVRARCYYLQSCFIFHFSNSDYAASYDAARRVVQLMEDNHHLVMEHPENYVNGLQNLVMISVLSQPLEVSLAYIGKLRNFAETFPEVRFDETTQRRVPVFAGNLELQLLMAQGDMERAALRLNEVLAQIHADGYRYNINEGYVLLSLYFKAANIHLHRREYRQALSFVNRILNQEGVGTQYDAHLAGKLLQVVILFEAGELQMLESALLSLYRFLRQKRKLYRFERALIEFIRKASGELAGPQLTAHFARLRENLHHIAEDPKERLALMHFNILGWLDARMGQAQH